ncbi:Predicted dehydrogenase [Methylophilus rhizosphaerae]|uniref:Predicted dehydrogenase n=1 Tax=Methylophilus rhizosphaerae TaxID=492660 RepID=A0A1G9CY27_9PROT|nr:Gfo/Idh/MocA family oxidoreductase [Methylophilus rhizosphaerae]SDK56559.1 Predicted dehydrogenase [Methylophilus rhizosphaerae]
MTAKLNWGILGAARVNERLLPAIVEATNAQLVAIASRRPGAAKATLDKYAPNISGVTCYDDMQSLLHDENVQAVYCPMANEEHAEWALKAISAGKHVLIEKPMTTSLAEIARIEAAAKAKGVKVMEGFMYRFHPQHAKVQQLIDSGLIGDVLSCRASFSFLMAPARMYRINRDMVHGGGAMWDIGPYAIHALRWCFQNNGVPAEPKNVVAYGKLNDHGADVVASGILDFGPDAQGRARFGHFDVSFERGRKAEYEIIGDKGWIKCHNMWAYPGDDPVISWEAGGKSETLILPKANHFNLEIEHFSDCVLNGKAPLLTFDDAKGNCRTIEAVISALSE